MASEKSKLDRRSTRLPIAIPITISGVDAEGRAYAENVRTVVINKHGGKIATTRQISLGSAVLIENHAMHSVAKSTVVWLGENTPSGEIHQVGLQLVEARNIWGIAFPPDDWVSTESS